jgi:hypothetical protein
MKIGPKFQIVVTVLTGKNFRDWYIAVAAPPIIPILINTVLKTT